MPYFPRSEQTPPYRCPACGGYFYAGNTSCLVNHAPGTCCHKYETPALSSRRLDKTNTAR